MYWNNKISLLILILFVFGCATGTSIVSSGSIYQGMSKQKVRSELLSSYPGDDPFINGRGQDYRKSDNKEIIWGSSGKVYYVFKDVTIPHSCGLILCNNGNGTLESWHYTLSDARNSIKIKDKKVLNKKKPKLTVTSNNNANIDYIKELNILIKEYENGVITEEEFSKKKSEILK